MNYRLALTALTALAASLALAACSFENHYESLADQFTRAAMSDNFSPVETEIAPGMRPTDAQIGAMADELSHLGKLVSVKQVTQGCEPSWYCFSVKFENALYHERLQLDDHGKVVRWQYHVAPPGAAL